MINRFMRRVRWFFRCERWDEPRWLDAWEREKRERRRLTDGK